MIRNTRTVGIGHRSLRQRRLRGSASAIAAALLVICAACSSNSNSQDQQSSAPTGTSAATTSSSAGSSPGSTADSPATSAATDTATSASTPLTPVSAYTGFKYSVVQWYYIYEWGKDQGFFAKYGIDPSFAEGPGSAGVVQLIANNKADFGVSVAPANAIEATSQGAPLQIIAEETPEATIAILSRSDKPIKTPADIKGKTIGYDPTSYAGVLFDALLKTNGISAGSFQQVSVNGNAYAAALKSKTIDGYISAPDTNIPTLKGIGIDPVVMNFSDFGVDAGINEVVIATKDTLDNKKSTVQAFLKGLNDTYQYLIDHPEAYQQVAEAGAKNHPEEIKTDVALQQLQLHFDYVRKGLTPGQIPLHIQSEKIASLVTLLTDTGLLKNPLAPEKYYTTDFLPAG